MRTRAEVRREIPKAANAQDADFGPQRDDVAISTPETEDEGLVDASTRGLDASHTGDQQSKIDVNDDNSVDTGGWRLLSRGKDRQGRIRFQLALGSGLQRQWAGPTLLLEVVEDAIRRRNERESRTQAARRRIVRESRDADAGDRG